MKKLLLIALTGCLLCSCKSKADLKEKLQNAIREDLLKDTSRHLLAVDSLNVYKIDTLTALKDSQLVERKANIRSRQTRDVLKLNSFKIHLFYSQSLLLVHDNLLRESQLKIDSMKELTRQNKKLTDQLSEFDKRAINITTLKTDHKIDSEKQTGYFVSYNFKGKDKEGSFYKDSTGAVLNNNFKVVRYELY